MNTPFDISLCLLDIHELLHYIHVKHFTMFYDIDEYYGKNTFAPISLCQFDTYEPHYELYYLFYYKMQHKV